MYEAAGLLTNSLSFFLIDVGDTSLLAGRPGPQPSVRSLLPASSHRAKELALLVVDRTGRMPRLVVEPRRRRRRFRDRVQRDVREQLVLGEDRLGIPASVAPRAELLHDPSGKADGRVVQTEAERLRLGHLYRLIAGFIGPEHHPFFLTGELPFVSFAFGSGGPPMHMLRCSPAMWAESISASCVLIIAPQSPP
jgi:hypothetical protein